MITLRTTFGYLDPSELQQQYKTMLTQAYQLCCLMVPKLAGLLETHFTSAFTRVCDCSALHRERYVMIIHWTANTLLECNSFTTVLDSIILACNWRLLSHSLSIHNSPICSSLEESRHCKWFYIALEHFNHISEIHYWQSLRHRDD